MKSTFSLLPEQATKFAAEIDLLYLFILAVSVVLTLVMLFNAGAFLVGELTRRRIG